MGVRFLRAQRSQQEVVGAGFARDDRHGFLALRLGALADHLAGNDEIEPPVAKAPCAGLVDHEDLAIEARVQVLAVAVLRVDHDVLVFRGHIDDVQLDTELLRHPQRVVPARLGAAFLADGVGVALHAEAGVEIQPLDMYALLLDDLCRQHGVKSAGDERNGLFHAAYCSRSPWRIRRLSASGTQTRERDVAREVRGGTAREWRAVRALCQRVAGASVAIDGETVARVDQGLLVFLGVFRDDTETQAEKLAAKTSRCARPLLCGRCSISRGGGTPAAHSPLRTLDCCDDDTHAHTSGPSNTERRSPDGAKPTTYTDPPLLRSGGK